MFKQVHQRDVESSMHNYYKGLILPSSREISKHTRHRPPGSTVRIQCFNTNRQYINFEVGIKGILHPKLIVHQIHTLRHVIERLGTFSVTRMCYF